MLRNFKTREIHVDILVTNNYHEHEGPSICKNTNEEEFMKKNLCVFSF